jgi:NTP pyrophosphatase (non-canonical NTP hydrolase)
METEIVKLILKYYEERQLKLPDVWKSLAFLSTELGEVYELLLSREGGWVRNNPESKPSFSKERLSEELGDVIMMAVVAGLAEGVDPIKSMEEKINRKLNKISKGSSNISIIDSIDIDKEFEDTNKEIIDAYKKN